MGAQAEANKAFMRHRVRRVGEVIDGDVRAHQLDRFTWRGGCLADLDRHQVHVDEQDRPPSPGEPGRGSACPPSEKPIGITRPNDSDPRWTGQDPL